MILRRTRKNYEVQEIERDEMTELNLAITPSKPVKSPSLAF